MRTNFFCTNFSNTARGPGHPGKNPGISQIPLFETQGRQTFKGGHEVFGHHPFAWKTPTPPGGLRTQKVNLKIVLFFLPEYFWGTGVYFWGTSVYFWGFSGFSGFLEFLFLLLGGFGAPWVGGSRRGFENI